jgi:hypothetical protein
MSRGRSRRLQDDPWMMNRIVKALDSIRYSDFAGLETELELLVFAEDVIDKYGDELAEDGYQNGYSAGYLACEEGSLRHE